MSASNGEKIFMTVLFVLVGLPPGLCSIFGMPIAIGTLFDRTPGSGGYALLFGVSSLVGLAIFGLMLRWLIRTWRHDPA